MAVPAASIVLRGAFTLRCPIEKAFPFFSPLGEKHWVPGWNPTVVHPPGVDWSEGQVFTTPEEKGEAVWVVTRLDRARHEVAYARVEPGRYVAQVQVHCSPLVVDGTRDAARSEVRVQYTFIGLSEAGNAEIAAMSEAAYARKMRRWQGWIEAHLETSGGAMAATARRRAATRRNIRKAATTAKRARTAKRRRR